MGILVYERILGLFYCCVHRISTAENVGSSRHGRHDFQRASTTARPHRAQHLG